MPIKPEGYFKGRICCVCGEYLSTGDHGLRHYDEKGIWNGPYDDAYHSLNLADCKYLRKG